jgi:hypothetical protein
VASRSATDSDLLSATSRTAATSGGTPAAAAAPFSAAADVRRCWSSRGFPTRSGDVTASSAGSNPGDASGNGFHASARLGVLLPLLLLLTAGAGAGVRGDGGEGEGDLAGGAGVNGDGSEGDGDLAAGAGVSGEGDGDGDLAAVFPCEGVGTTPVARRSCGRACPAAARPSCPLLSTGEPDGKCRGESCGRLAFAVPSSLAEPYSSGGDASKDGVGVWYSSPGSGHSVSIGGGGTGGGGLSGADVRGVDGMVCVRRRKWRVEGRDQGAAVFCMRSYVLPPLILCALRSK